MLRHPTYTRDRIAQVGDRIRALIYPDVRDPDELVVAGPVDRIDLADAELLEYRPCRLGERFGPLWATYWFRVAATVPEDWRGARVDLLWVSHSEATLWMDGAPLQGLNTSPDGAAAQRHGARQRRGRRAARPPRRARLQRPVRRAAAALRRPRAGRPRSLPDRPLRRAAWRLHHDFDVLRAPRGRARAAGLDRPGPASCCRELNRFCNLWSRTSARPGTRPRRSSRRLLERRNGTRHARAVGDRPRPPRHGLAVADRRDLAQGRAHVQHPARATWTDYPEYRFACSQAQHYDWIEAPEPATCSDRIRDRVAAGQWMPVGGTWIEPDCNLPSGESLVRQFLHGQRFFERELGRRCHEFWNPDVFGYDGQLPQIMRGAGIDRFLTQKLSWNRFNQPAVPHLHVAGHRRQPRCSPTSRRPTPTTPRPPWPSCGAAPATTRTTTARATACSCSATATGAAGRRPTCSRRCAAAATCRACRGPRSATSDEFFDALEAEAQRAARPSSASSTSSTTAAPTPARPRSSAATGAASGLLHDAEFLRAVAHGAGGRCVPARAADRALADCCCSTSSTTSCPARRSARCTTTLQRDHAAVLAGAEAAVEVRSRRWRHRRPEHVPLNTLGVPAGRGGRTAGRRRAGVGDGAAVRDRRGGRGRPGRCHRGRARQTASCSTTGPACRVRTRRPPRVARARGDRPRVAGGAGQPPAAVRRPPDRLRGLGRRPVPPGDRARGGSAAEECTRDGWRGCAPRSEFQHRIGAVERDAAGRAARRRGATDRVPLRGRLARARRRC